MLYFIILPVWLTVLVVMGVATVATRAVGRLAPAFPYAWRVLLWSTVGFVAANALVFALYLLVARAANAISQPVHPAAQLGIGTALILVPVVASAAGFVGGACVGMLLGLRARRRGRVTTAT